MPHATPARRPSTLAAAATPVAGRRRPVRRLVVVRQRHGIVLIFVVVLLTLLSIMGTAYLATSRLDRQAITGRGALPGANTPLLPDQTTLARVNTATEDAVKAVLIKDLFNQNYSVRLGSTAFANQAFGTFRQVVANSTYTNADAAGRTDPYLASLLPARTLPASSGYYNWPWIGRPLGIAVGGDVNVAASENFYFEPFFTDPRKLTTTGYSSLTPDRFATFNPAVAFPTPGTPAELTERNAVTIGWAQMLRDAGPSPRQYGDNTRVYPALVPGGRAMSAANILLAGDADGDGIADSGMVPIAINPSVSATGPNAIDRYLDRANGVVYFASYRVVDNGAKINIATALTNRGDVTGLEIVGVGTANEHADRTNQELRSYLGNDPAATPAPPALPPGALGPNYGFFRANVGLAELVRSLLSPLNQTPESTTATQQFTPAEAEMRRFIDARFPQLRQNVPATGATYDSTPGGTGALDGIDIEKLSLKFGLPAVAELSMREVDGAPAGLTVGLYKYRSFGDLLEQQVARRPDAPGSYLWSNSTAAPDLSSNALIALGQGDAASLAAKNGTLVNPLISPGTGESALMFTARMAAPNVNNNGQTPWGWFPANAVGLWFGWTQDFEPDSTVTPPTIAALDAATPQLRAFHYAAGTAANELGLAGSPGVDESKPAGTADVYLPRSPRTLLTAYSGTTTAVPQRRDQPVTPPPGPAATPGVPIGMPAYAAADVRIGGAAVANSAYGTDPAAAGIEPFWYPAAKVSAATGTKEQLWRAYWSAMTEQYTFQYVSGGNLLYSSYWNAARPIRNTLAATYEPNEFYDAFRSCDRYGTTENSFVNDTSRAYLPAAEQRTPDESLSQRQMALIRSAVAACNTVDLRDSDNDITAMNVDITDDDSKTGGSAAQARYYARVYGTEKQLVITGVYMDEAPGGNYFAIEIYNPTDIPIQLSAYRLGLVTRTPGATPKTTGTIADTAGTNPIRLGTDATEFLQPGGYVIVSSLAADPATVSIRAESTHGTSAPTATPEVYRLTPTNRAATIPGFTAALFTAAPRDKEIVLTRTRRADGVAFTDDTATAAGVNSVRNVIENEVLGPALPSLTETATDLTTLVPVDSVDVRRAAGGVAPPTARYSYLRAVPAHRNPAVGVGTAADPLSGARNLQRDGAWRCFYAGKFYNLRPAASGTARIVSPTAGDIESADELPIPTPPAVAKPNTLAWRELSATAAPVELGQPTVLPAGRPMVVTPRTTAGPLLAPAIPIQNFSPIDPYTATNVRTVSGSPANANEVYGGAPTPANRGVFHLLSKFPYGSPFARDADLLSVPYIGTYKIYRQTGTGAGDVDLYEFISLPMDAWIVAPDATLLTTVGGAPAEVTTIGRFYPRFELGTSGPYHFNGITNEWAGRLTDFVSAREAPYKTYQPDVPDASILSTFYDTTTTGTTADQRFAQDGPVTGSGAANGFNDVPWTAHTERTGTGSDTALTGTTRTGIRRGQRTNATAAQVALTQGVINVNTAPAIVLRQLPWVVDPATGLVDPAIVDVNLRTLVGQVTDRRKTIASQAWTPATEPHLTFAFTSLMGLNTEATATTLKTTTNAVIDANQLMRLGMLHPIDRPENGANYLSDTLNITRVSNLASTRSDVFTVYVTVQAWTWTGDDTNQSRDTRLVGERRSSFIVDRSRITQTNYATSDLVVLPVERE